MASDTEITKVRIVIRHLLWQIREVRNDRDAAWKWVNRFANTLQYQDLEQDPDQYALAILAEARSFNDQKKRNGQMKWVREQLAKEGVTSPTQEQLDEKWLEMYGNETTADGDIREDSQDRKSRTSADIYGDAATREGAEDRKSTTSPSSGTLDSLTDKANNPVAGNTANTDPDRGHDSGNPYDQEPTAISTNGPRQAPSRGGSAATIKGDACRREPQDGVTESPSSTTISEPMGRVPQNGTHPRIQGGKRAAQGAMSPSPSGAAQDGKFRGSAKTQGESNTGSTVPAVRPESGNIYDQETSRISTDEARESQGRTDGHSLRVGNVARPPARSSGAMPDDAQLVYDFAAAENLDPVDAYECWNVTVNERDGKTADGKKVTNWKAYVRKWCVTRASNRRTA